MCKATLCVHVEGHVGRQPVSAHITRDQFQVIVELAAREVPVSTIARTVKALLATSLSDAVGIARAALAEYERPNVLR